MWPFKKSPHPEPSVSYGCAMLVKSLREHPCEWRFDEHYLVHAQGAKIWIGNWDILWSRCAWLHDGFLVVPKGEDCKIGVDHRSLHSAVEFVRDYQT